MEVFPQESMLFSTRKKERIGEMQETKHGQLVCTLFSIKSDIIYDVKVNLCGKTQISILTFVLILLLKFFKERQAYGISMFTCLITCEPVAEFS
jgi:hypothetical protein